MDFSQLEPAYYWLIAGALFLAIEAFGIPGIGFLFAGLASIVVGLLVNYQIVAEDNLIAQFGWFFGITAVLAAALWKKLQEWRTNPSGSAEFKNIVGDIAVVGKDGLKKGKMGQVNWSGTTMMAEISSKSEKTEFESGDVVEIVEVKGNKLIVAPQSASE